MENIKLLLFVIMTMFAQAALAQTYSFELQGTINRIFSTGGVDRPIPSDFFIHIDDTFSATVTVDTDGATLSSSSPPNLAIYQLLPPQGQLGISATINNAQATTDSGFIRLDNDNASGHDRISYISSGLNGDTVNGLTWASLSLVLVDTDGNLLSNLDLPNSVGDAAEYESMSFSLFFNDANNLPVAQASGLGTASITVLSDPVSIPFMPLAAVLVLASFIFLVNQYLHAMSSSRSV